MADEIVVAYWWGGLERFIKILPGGRDWKTIGLHSKNLMDNNGRRKYRRNAKQKKPSHAVNQFRTGEQCSQNLRIKARE